MYEFYFALCKLNSIFNFFMNKELTWYYNEWIWSFCRGWKI